MEQMCDRDSCSYLSDNSFSSYPCILSSGRFTCHVRNGVCHTRRWLVSWSVWWCDTGGVTQAAPYRATLFAVFAWFMWFARPRNARLASPASRRHPSAPTRCFSRPFAAAPAASWPDESSVRTGTAGELWLTAAIPMDNPYFSCKPTPVRPRSRVHGEQIPGGDRAGEDEHGQLRGRRPDVPGPNQQRRDRSGLRRLPSTAEPRRRDRCVVARDVQTNPHWPCCFAADGAGG